MSLTDFYHGVETVTVDSGARPIRTVRSSVIMLYYTATSASEVAYPFYKPMLFNRRSDYSGLGVGGTGRRALDAIFNQIGALVIGCRIPEGMSLNEQFSKFLQDPDPSTGAYRGIDAVRAAEAECGVAPMIFIAPGFMHQRPNGVSAITIGAQGSGYTAATAVFSGGGATVQATADVIVENGKVVGFTMKRLGIGYTGAPTITISGDGTGAAATATLGASANPVVGSMLGLANEFRAHIIADGPSTTDAAAFAARGDYGSRRVFMVDPHVSTFSPDDETYATIPSSAAVAGLIAKTDNESGYWESPSNKELFGIGGLARPVDYAWGSKNSRANILNENEIATVIRDDGWRLWGNRTCSADPKYAFLSISRTSDIIDISIAKAHKWAVDKGIRKGYFKDVEDSVNGFFRYQKRQGSVLGGECWHDPELNGPDQITQGHVTFDYKFGGIYPAERVTFRSQLTDEYIKDLFK